MSNTVQYCLQIVNQLYENINGYQISARSRDHLENNDCSLTYGELTEESITELLAIVQPCPGEVFYDLGSGAGKPVFWASIMYDWQKCCGIEILKELYLLSLGQLQKLLADPELTKLLTSRKLNIQFINDSFLNYDFSDANVILLNATAFSYELWTNLVEKIVMLPIGVRIIVLTKSINSNKLELIHSRSYLMSWGMNLVNIYKKVK